MMYKKTLHEAENVQPQLSAEIDRLQRENQFLKKQYHAVMRVNVLLTKEMSLQAQSYEEMFSKKHA